MAIKVIVELQAKPGRRAELRSLLESLVAKHGPSQRGFKGTGTYAPLQEMLAAPVRATVIRQIR